MKKISIIVVLLVGFISQSFSQDSIAQNFQSPKKNIIRWNVTPLVINTNNFTLGYERVLKNNQSISINMGILLFPQFLSEDLVNNNSLSVLAVKKGSRFGFTTAIDYRFYLKKRNKRPAPDGVYIGPFFAYYNYSFDNKLTYSNSNNVTNEIGLDASFTMASLGIELGYQFIFWDKLTLDLILIGPSLSYYNGKAKLVGDLNIDEESDAYKYLEEQILNKYPWVESFIDLNAINTGGSISAVGAGFRYVIQVGFHF